MKCLKLTNSNIQKKKMLINNKYFLINILFNVYI